MRPMKELRARWKRVPKQRAVVAALGCPGVVTVLAIPDEHPSRSVVTVLYVLSIIVAARLGGSLAGVGASLVSFLALNFFFTPPLHTFVVGTLEDVVALFVFLIVSAIVGLLFSTAVEARARSEQHEREARLLNRLATRLLSGEAPEDPLAAFSSGIVDLFDLAHCEIDTEFTQRANATVEGDHPEPSREVPLIARGKEIGMMRLWFGRRDRLGDDEEQVLQSLVTQLALALESMRLSLEVRRAELEVSATQLKAALFSGVTHDVKTPLSAIMAAVTSLIDGRGFSEDERGEHLDTIRHEAERLHRVVNNLLDVARLRAGALVASKTPSPIDELMESVVHRLRPTLQEREVEMRVGDDVPEIPMDVVQIDQVLTNLIENATKFTPAGSPISLFAVGHPEGVRVTVADRGPGIARSDRDRILEPFETGGTSGSGTGLGLAISNAIVVAHGGRMWIAEAPGGGAAITFELPCGTEATPRR